MENMPLAVVTSMRYDFPEDLNTDLLDEAEDYPDLSIRAHAHRLDRSTAALGWEFVESASGWPASRDLHYKGIYLKQNIDKAIVVGLEAGEWPFQITQDELQQRWSREPTPDVRAPVASWRVRVDLLDPLYGGSVKFTIAPLLPVDPSPKFDSLKPDRLPCITELVSIMEPTWKIFISREAVTPDSYTRHKTSERKVYDTARKGIGANVEVLLCNDDGEIMDGTISTPYFFRNDSWVTPAASCGGLDSVTKRYALLKRLATEARIRPGDLKEGLPILLSNSVRGWGWGRLEVL